MNPGTRVTWTFTDYKGREDVVIGTVQEFASHGRIKVLSDDGSIHYIQPDQVELVKHTQQQMSDPNDDLGTAYAHKMFAEVVLTSEDEDKVAHLLRRTNGLDD